MAMRPQELACDCCYCIVPAGDTCSHCGAALRPLASSERSSVGRRKPMNRAVVRGLGLSRPDKHPGLLPLFRSLEKWQSPKACFIACSDSKDQISLLTQAVPGDLFILRNAGNIVPSFGGQTVEEAVLEYAVCGLRIPHIVVCGHTRCGAMAALLAPKRLRPLPSVWRWIGQSEPAFRCVEARRLASDKEQLADLVRENVLLQLAQLRSYPFVATAVKARALRIHGWIYDFGKGTFVEINPRNRKVEDARKVVAAWA